MQSNKAFNFFVYFFLGLCILSFFSQISIPIKPIPITMQSFGVTLIGLTFERKAAILAVLAYLILGAMGLPVFTEFRSGIDYLLGPAGGYLFGFLIAVIVMTQLRFLKQHHFFVLLFQCLIGTFVILACGVAWLSFLIGFKSAIQGGLMPFIIPGLLKSILLASLVYLLWKK